MTEEAQHDSPEESPGWDLGGAFRSAEAVMAPALNGNGAAPAPPAPAAARAELPAPPRTLDASGLSMSFLLELVLKIIHYAETPTADYIARVLGLPAVLTGQILDALKSARLAEIISTSASDLTTSYRFRLTEKGEQRAEQALDRCRYAGAAPVPLAQYEKVIAAQSLNRWRAPVDAIRGASESLVLDPGTADYLQRALHSGRSTMIYGPSGNGKTHLLTEFISRLEGEVLVPYSLYAYGQIIRMYDSLVHQRVDGAPSGAKMLGDGPVATKGATALDDSGDRRWVRIRRPGVIVGGEFSAESLELGYDPIAKFYQAPKHFKAQGGVLVVDDFGRQRVSPAELLNRWIMALERGRDNLLLRTGESIDVPFSIALLFSTNLNPTDLADAAYLRRIPYKAYMPPVEKPQFIEILRRVIGEERVEGSEDSVCGTVDFLYQATNNLVSGSLARDLIWILIDNAEHEGHAPVLTVPAIDLAYQQFTGVAGRRTIPSQAPDAVSQSLVADAK